MRTSIVLTIIGPDRPGLVEALSTTVGAHGGNWEQSRMAHLGGQFAGILKVSVAPERAEALSAALGALPDLRVTSESSHGAAVHRDQRALRLELVGNDQEGIVRDLSTALAERGVNVEELHTECESAAQAGGMLFRARARLLAPAGLSMDELAEALESIADDLMVDIAIAPDTD